MALEFFLCCFLIIQFHVKKKSNPITEYFAEKLNIEKQHFNTGAYDRLMTEAPTRMFGQSIKHDQTRTRQRWLYERAHGYNPIQSRTLFT